MHPRLKLAHVVANWDNLNGTPVEDRSWDGSVYRSPTSYMDADVLYSRRPGTHKLYVVFLSHAGRVALRPEETVVSLHRANEFFEEGKDGASDIQIVGTELSLAPSVTIQPDVLFGSGVLGEAYIVTLGP